MPAIKNTYSFFYHWHQRIGLAMCIAVIAWALSGLAHPIISRLNPQPAAPLPAETLSVHGLGEIATLLSQHNIQQLAHVRLFHWQGQPVYRIEHEHGVQYFAADTLTLLTLNDFEYARALADHALGDPEAAVTDVQLVTEFDEDYLYINRFLPVIRIDYDRADGASVYIDAQQGRLATINDRKKILLGKFFRAFHSWTWISNTTLRKTLMTVFLVAGFSTALFGWAVWFSSWRRGMFRTSVTKHHPTTRRWHRRLGGVAGLFAMTFTATGLLHLHLSDQSEITQPHIKQAISTQELQLNSALLQTQPDPQGIIEVQLVSIGDEPYWRIKKLPNSSTPAAHELDHPHHHHNEVASANDNLTYLHALSGEPLHDGARQHAQHIALTLSQFPQEAVSGIELIDSFNSEYGFVNKRLPVHAVRFDLPGKPALFIETSTSTLASSATNSRRFEGYSFAYLHKWHLIDIAGHTLKDIFTSLAVLSIILTLLLGGYRFFAQRRKVRRVKTGSVK